MDKRRLKNIMYIVYMLIIAVVATVIMSMRVSAWPAVAVDSETVYLQNGLSGYTGPRIGYSSVNPDNFTSQDLKNLTEALSLADYSTYETMTGRDYEIKRFSLKYGYAVEIVTTTDNDSMAEETANGTSVFNNKNMTDLNELFSKYISVSIVFVNSKSESIADIYLSSVFVFDYYKQVGIDNLSIFIDSEIKDISFSNMTAAGGQPDTNASAAACDIYVNPNLQINGTTIDNLVLQISCNKKGFASSQVMSLEKAIKSSKYTNSLKNNSYLPLDFSNGHSVKESILAKDEFTKVFESIASAAPYEIKVSVNKDNLTGVDGKYEKIDLKNGYYLELRLQIIKIGQNANDLSNNLTFTLKNSKNGEVDSFGGSISGYSKWDGKTVSFTSSPNVVVRASAKDFINFSVSAVKTSKDSSSAASTLTIGSALTNSTFNIDLTCDKDGGMTVRITK